MNRKQFIKFNGGVSTVKTLTFGVPQGSVLGPLLILLYTADLGKLMDAVDCSHIFMLMTRNIKPQEVHRPVMKFNSA
jgi:hypothetical protein